MKKKIVFALMGFILIAASHAQNTPSQKGLDKEKKWLVEPVKITSLMVNTHPEYNGWGLEVGRKLADKLWLTTMVEKTQGGDFASNFDPTYDYLITFDYLASLTTLRYYIDPHAVYTTFFDGGIEHQRASHQFLREAEVMQESAVALGPILFIGGEWHFHENIYFKWRMGGFINLYRGGTMKSRIDDGQNQPPYYLYPHLADAVTGIGSYAGDVAFGIKF